MQKRVFRKSKGFTLTELAIVLGITGTVLGGIWEAASYAYLNSKLNQTVDDLMIIVSNVRAMYGMTGNMQQPNFTDITTNLVGADIMPQTVPIVGGRPYNVFGGQIKMESQGNCGGPWTLGSCDATSFEIEFFPPAGTHNPCSALVTRILGAGRDPGLLAVYDDVDGWRDPKTIVPRNISPNCSYVSLAYKLRIQ